ncbi:MAG: hypothetical protein FJX74_02740 [Armatimonadetes bacterium]|nr:hypothetical protein [Armatimonadota bacterium]
MTRLPPPPATETEAPPEPPQWVLGRSAGRRETNWDAVAIYLCVLAISLASAFAGICLLRFLVGAGVGI